MSFLLFFFQLIVMLPFSFLGSKPTTTMRYHCYELRTIGATTTDVIWHLPRFFFVFFLSFSTNYNTLLYKPRDTTSAGCKQATLPNDDRLGCRWASSWFFFISFLSFFQLNSCFFFIFLGCKPTSTTTTIRYHRYESQTSHAQAKWQQMLLGAQVIFFFIFSFYIYN